MTAKQLALALRGLAQDVRDGTAGEYQAHALDRIAAEVAGLQARDLIGLSPPCEVPRETAS